MLKRLIHSLLGSTLVVLAIVLNLALAAPAQATGVYQMPPLSDNTWIVDDAGVLSRFNEGKITNQLKELAQTTGNEVRMVTIHRLDYGETPASFATALLKKWFPEPESRINQTILVLDDVTNIAALATGSDAANLLTEEIADSVTQETIGLPLRQASKYNKALVDASDRLIAVLSGSVDPGPPTETTSYEIESTFASAEETDENRSNATMIVVGFLIAATVIPMATYYFYQAMGG
ncbi:MAG: YgcG family protein [Leptolyngbya sp. SIO1D8]|nr:YgcG family protein [Leptolyngbya sp. SIO1D8]